MMLGLGHSSLSIPIAVMPALIMERLEGACEATKGDVKEE